MGYTMTVKELLESWDSPEGRTGYYEHAGFMYKYEDEDDSKFVESSKSYALQPCFELLHKREVVKWTIKKDCMVTFLVAVLKGRH